MFTYACMWIWICVCMCVCVCVCLCVCVCVRVCMCEAENNRLIQLENEAIAVADNFTCHGSNITNDGKIVSEVYARLGKAIFKVLVWILRGVLW